MKIKDNINLPEAIHFIQNKMKEYDMSGVKFIKLNKKRNHELLHGRCTYPTKIEKQYKINAAINPDHPYPATHLHWGRIKDDSFKQGWRSDQVMYKFDNVTETAIHLLAHEIAHYLLRVKQIKEKNVEANANMIADQWLDEYRKSKT